MKIVRIILAAFFIAFAATSCENIGLLGQGGVKGSTVKADITAIATRNNLTFSSYYGSLVGIIIMIDDIVVPGLAGISDSAHYTKGSVDACKSKMSSVGLIIDNWIGAISCSLKKVPPIIQIGDNGL